MDTFLIDRYKTTIDEIINKYNYNSNISHLLYIIIPAFIAKYKKDQLIIDTFKNTKILISEEINNKAEAFYTSIPSYNNNQIITTKYIVINNYENISLVQLLDNLVHEFNHAINSYKNEQTINNNILYLRTGITNISYELTTLKQIKKDNSYLLEEILNTKQTEEIIDIIKNYNNITDDKINNIIYSLNAETNINYSSKAYYPFMQLLKPLLENNTFTSTLNQLRITGSIIDIEPWFNNITNINNSYNKLNNSLIELIELNNKLENQKIFKSITINKIKDIINEIRNIIDTFNSNTNYK